MTLATAARPDTKALMPGFGKVSLPNVPSPETEHPRDTPPYPFMRSPAHSSISLNRSGIEQFIARFAAARRADGVYGRDNVLLDQIQRPVIILIGAPRIVSGNPTTVPSVLPAACCPCEAEAGFTAMFFSSTGTSCGAISASWANLL
jgi:hypothetical protein